MDNANSVIKRWQKLGLQSSFVRLAEEIEKVPLSDAQCTKMLERIVLETLNSNLTPQESRQLTKAVSRPAGRKER